MQGRVDGLHLAALWTTALAFVVLVAAVSERWHFTGFSKAQEARKTRFTRFELLDARRAACCRSRPCSGTCSSRT